MMWWVWVWEMNVSVQDSNRWETDVETGGPDDPEEVVHCCEDEVEFGVIAVWEFTDGEGEEVGEMGYDDEAYYCGDKRD